MCNIKFFLNFSGGYIVFEEEFAADGQEARLISAPITNTDHNIQCFKFWYHMYGVDVGTSTFKNKLDLCEMVSVFCRFSGELAIYHREMHTVAETLLWYLRGNQQETWREGEIPLQTAEPFQVRFFFKIVCRE